MSFALIFSGQGTQHVGMLPWLRDDERVEEMCGRLGVHDWRRSLEDLTWARNNANAQTLMTALELAAWEQLAFDVPSPAAIAGYSVGELAAFSVAGVYSAAAATSLAPLRAAAMDHCASPIAGGLVGVTGLAQASMQRVCREAGVALAIQNDIDNVVLGGPEHALIQACKIVEAEGGRCTRLRVSVASHTSLMAEATTRFAQSLTNVHFEVPRTALFSNTGERIGEAQAARQALAAQISETVRWDECMDNIAARQVRCVLELGAGQALTRLWNRRYPSIPARAADDFRSVAALAGWLVKYGEN